MKILKVIDMEYENDLPIDAVDAMILAGSGAEPPFDPVLREFLLQSHADLIERIRTNGLLRIRSLGVTTPWLYRLTFSTRGYRRDEEGIEIVEQHEIALRFLPDFLRRADQFSMLRLIKPIDAFHPNIASSGAICVEIYPGETVLEICHSLHDLIRWRLCQYDERDALNSIACAWGRDNVEQPLDDRPLFGRAIAVQWQPTTETQGA